MPASPKRDAEALQREMDEARADMADTIEQLKLTVRQRVDLRRQLQLHPMATLAVVAVGSLGVALTIRHFVQHRRMRRTLEELARRRPWYWYFGLL